MSDTIIRVDNLYKEYRLGTVGHGTLRHDLASWWANIRGKDDPNSLITNRPSPQTPLPASRGKGLKEVKKDEEELKKHFLALNDVSFEVKRGDVLGIIGRNGAGKSTLLKLLSRVTAPSSGSIKIKGKMASLLEVGTGFHPEMTGRENIYMNGAILGMRRWEIARKMDEIIAFAELEKFIDTPVKRYSSGMYVRLAFSVAAHLDADILLMDEVLAVGDATFQKKCLGKMDDVAKNQGRTVLFVSHNMGAVKELCSKCIMLNNGFVEKQGNITDVINSYMQVNTNTHGTYSWPNGIGTSKMKMHSVRISNMEGLSISAFQRGEPIFLDCSYQMFSRTENVNLGFSVIASDGTHVFTSEDTDKGLHKVKDVGVYSTRVRIPENFFNVGTYFISLAAHIPMQEVIFSVENILSFNVDNIDTYGNYVNDSRKGVTRPLLDWCLQKE